MKIVEEKHREDTDEAPYPRYPINPFCEEHSRPPNELKETNCSSIKGSSMPWLPLVSVASERSRISLPVSVLRNLRYARALRELRQTAASRPSTRHDIAPFDQVN